MTLLELIQNRYSVRAYLPDAVEDEKLNYILECARLAPSACNFQPWRFYVVKSDEAKKIVRKSYDRTWLDNVPLYIVVTKNNTESWKRNDGKDSGDIDAAIVAEHICLAATEQNLGTCWICNFHLSILSQGLNIPQDEEAIAIFPIGYEHKGKIPVPLKKRKSIDDVTRWI